MAWKTHSDLKCKHELEIWSSSCQEVLASIYKEHRRKKTKGEAFEAVEWSKLLKKKSDTKEVVKKVAMSCS